MDLMQALLDGHRHSGGQAGGAPPLLDRPFDRAPSAGSATEVASDALSAAGFASPRGGGQFSQPTQRAGLTFSPPPSEQVASSRVHVQMAASLYQLPIHHVEPVPQIKTDSPYDGHMQPALSSRCASLAKASFCQHPFSDVSGVRGHLQAPASSGVDFRGVVPELGAAVFAAFMATTDTVSMGAVLFPGAVELKQQGIRMCLLTMAMSNIMLAATSRVPHGVSSLTDTVVPILAAFFQTVGCVETAMVAISILTVFTGLATCLAARIGIGAYIRACPYAVFGGFVAGTGAQLIEFGLNMMLPEFKSVLDADSWAALLTAEGVARCGPGFGAAALVFLLQRRYPSMDSLLLPVTVVAMTVIFFACLGATGTSLEEARKSGWLFDAAVPDRVDVFKVWTARVHPCCIKWDKIFCTNFFFTFIQLFLVSFLTTVKNIYGTSEFTRTRSEIDHEVLAAGILNTATGAVGGCPCGLVMSFSVTAHSMGARSKVFSWALAALSTVLFVLGDFLVAVLPKMVPACVVLWIGMVLLVFYAWDPLGTISPANYGIIVLMTVIDLWLGCGLMIVIGLFLSLLIMTREMLHLPAIRSSYDVSTVRSDVLRPAAQNNVLSTFGSRALVLQLEAGLLSFPTAFKVLDCVEQAALDFLVLDWALVHGVCDSATNTIKDLLRQAEGRGCVVVFAAARPGVEAALGRSGILLDARVNTRGASLAAEEFMHLPYTSRPVALVSDCEGDGCYVEAMVLALEFVEECIIYGDGYAKGRPRSASIRTQLTAQGEECVRAQLTRGVPLEHPAFAVALDLHIWLSSLHAGQYDACDLLGFADALSIAEYGDGDVIYRFEPEEVFRQGVQQLAASAATTSQAAPLVWLLEGEVEHYRDGCLDWDVGGASAPPLALPQQRGGGLRPRLRLEKASLPHTLDLEPGPGQCCLGPFRTTASFFGAMPHVGRLTARRDETRVALLQRGRYEQLARESPATANLLGIYLAKKQFVDLMRFPQPLGPTAWRRNVTY